MTKVAANRERVNNKYKEHSLSWHKFIEYTFIQQNSDFQRFLVNGNKSDRYIRNHRLGYKIHYLLPPCKTQYLVTV